MTAALSVLVTVPLLAALLNAYRLPLLREEFAIRRAY